MRSKPPQLPVQSFIGHQFPDRPAPGLNVSDQTGKPIDALPDLGRNVGELRYLAALRYVPPFEIGSPRIEAVMSTTLSPSSETDPSVATELPIVRRGAPNTRPIALSAKRSQALRA